MQEERRTHKCWGTKVVFVKSGLSGPEVNVIHRTLPLNLPAGKSIVLYTPAKKRSYDPTGITARGFAVISIAVLHSYLFGGLAGRMVLPHREVTYCVAGESSWSQRVLFCQILFIKNSR